MTIDLFTIHLKDFIKKHGITEDLPSRCRKLKIEVNELDEAILDGNVEEIIKEAADCAIVALHILLICNVVNPLFVMYLKLIEVSERPKYQQLARKVAENATTGRN